MRGSHLSHFELFIDVRQAKRDGIKPERVNERRCDAIEDVVQRGAMRRRAAQHLTSLLSKRSRKQKSTTNRANFIVIKFTKKTPQRTVFFPCSFLREKLDPKELACVECTARGERVPFGSIPRSLTAVVCTFANCIVPSPNSSSTAT